MTILVLNRSVLLVSPKQPAADWMLKVYEGPQLSDEEAHELFFAHYPVPYLIPETSKEEIDRRGVLNLLFQEIFEHELSTVRPDKKYWPNTASSGPKGRIEFSTFTFSLRMASAWKVPGTSIATRVSN